MLTGSVLLSSELDDHAAGAREDRRLDLGLGGEEERAGQPALRVALEVDRPGSNLIGLPVVGAAATLMDWIRRTTLEVVERALLRVVVRAARG